MSPSHRGSVLQHTPWPAGLQAAASQQSLVPSKLQTALGLSALASSHGWRGVFSTGGQPSCPTLATCLAFDILAFCSVMLLQQRAFTLLCKSDTARGICGTFALLMGLFMVLPSAMLGPSPPL